MIMYQEISINLKITYDPITNMIACKAFCEISHTQQDWLRG